MILFDTETTGLPMPEAATIEQQPYVIEFAAIRLDEKLKETGRIDFLCKPPILIPEEATKISGITNDKVAKTLAFGGHYKELCKFFLGEATLVGHNVNFDISMLRFELIRIGKLTAFPWPYEQVCTVERTLPMKGHRLNLSELHKMLTGKEHTGAHRAMADVEALHRVVLALRKKKMI